MLACSRRTIGRSKGAQETPNNWKSHEVDTVSTGQNFSALVSMELIGTHWNSSPFLALLRSRAHVIGYVGCRVSAGQFGGKKMKLKFLKWVKTSNTGKEQPRHFGTANEVKLSKLSKLSRIFKNFQGILCWILVKVGPFGPSLVSERCPGLLGRCGSKASMFVVGSRRLGTDGSLVSAGAPAHILRS